ncbi:hypothetical protein LCGC14_2895870 [marine sediment metagenome]|uniref:MPN domain-containing protein n=1 Tax=marine sediment metagenome TaxID=412755 RepID=A0A0F9A3Q6_9ZZZZ
MAEEKELEDLKLSIPLEFYQKLTAYVKACDNEISGFFDVVFDKEEKTFRVTKVYDLIKQEVGTGAVEIDEEGIAKFNAELIKEGVEQLPRGWWHSHNDMSTFLSVTDDTAIEKLDNGSYIVAIVLNKDNDIFAVVQLFDPVVIRIKLEVAIAYDDEKIIAKAEKEVADKVTEKSYSHASVDYGNGDERSPHWHQEKLRSLAEEKAQIVVPLPKKKRKALRMIRELKLLRAWDDELKSLTYTDESTNTVYIDYTGIISHEEWKVALMRDYDPSALQ